MDKRSLEQQFCKSDVITFIAGAIHLCCATRSYGRLAGKQSMGSSDFLKFAIAKFSLCLKSYCYYSNMNALK